jgi:hypothetical protein
MSQIFHHSANILSKISILGGVFIVAAALWLLALFTGSTWVHQAGIVRVQPIQFSHAHHVGGMGIDCRYCHTTVEESSFANIPPTKTCMNCHSQIWAQAPFLEPVRESFRTGESIQWTRVHNMPDFVYFDHSIHVHKGIGCATCHGRVDQMPLVYQYASLQMTWCLDCHRQPERFVRPREQVFNMAWQPDRNQLELGRELVAEYNIERLTSCSVCHR